MNEEILKNLQFESVKDKFTKAYNDAITRQGSRELLDWITNKTDFFVAPASSKFPESFWINHICTSFIETVKWWINSGMKESPKTISEYFYTVVFLDENFMQ